MSRHPVDLKAMKEWRHRIHEYPELGFEEYSTSKLVEERLRDWGYEVHTGMAETAVVGTLVFGSGTGPKLGLRADMDALPINEETGLPWQSKQEGKMHACGHDGHTAILLGAAESLSRLHAENEHLNGKIHLIFQPAEEVGGNGGAQVMIDQELFHSFPCDAIFALHNYPGLPVGHCAFRSGPFMCSSDKVQIVFKGKGGHGGLPQLAVDPTQPLAATVMGLQSLVSRNIDPLETGVVSVGRMSAGKLYNIIPEEGFLELSVRALQPNVRETLRRRIVELVESTAAAYGCTASINYENGYPVLINSENESKIIEVAAQEVFGVENVNTDYCPLTGSEDFAYMLQQRPGCYVLIGNGDNGFQSGNRVGPCSVHNPHYDFNDEALIGGAQLWVNLATRYLSSS
ncbi:M20 aminoacylase family protein [Marinobacter alexandrii]|jgi:hippurate hydrolase|uniref:M20 aminoacylase family protein n=1 Tax=Marinobacter alexandrii TaxID=2570351 RepID=UPI00110884A8|nr:M20 aminoacylase family protein [Marinobacter alexandrii]MCK2148058.1 M20 family metallopeptidase [Marinobacter alexandrii]